MAKRILTIECLETELQDDLAWRKKEILSFKMLIEKELSSEETLLRMGIALLCAHFEGFLKFASNCYVKYVGAQDIEINKLKENFFVFKLYNEFKQCENTEKNSVRQKLVRKMRELYSDSFNIMKDVISTHSNPSSEQIDEILKSLGIVTSIFETKAHYIDRNLLANRHKVVHGDRYPIRKEEFLQTFSMVVGLLDAFATVIIDAAENKNYLKENA